MVFFSLLPYTTISDAIGGVAAQADARERPRRGPRARGLLDGAGAIGRHAREGHRPRVREVTGRQRDIFDRLGYGLPTTS